MALSCAGLATLFKSSGVLYLVLIGLGMVVWERRSLRRRHVLQGGIALFLIGSLAWGTNLLRSQRAEGNDPLVGNIVDHTKTYAHLRDESDLVTFLPLPGQLMTAFVKMPNDTTPEAFTHSFWGALLRSSVDGMHRMDVRVENGIWFLRALMVLQMVLVLFAIHGACLGGRKDLFLTVMLLVFLCASMAFRWRYPFACSANIRYVAGLIIPFSILVGKSTVGRDFFVGKILWVAVIALSSLSVLFFGAFSMSFLCD